MNNKHRSITALALIVFLLITSGFWTVADHSDRRLPGVKMQALANAPRQFTVNTQPTANPVIEQENKPEAQLWARISPPEGFRRVAVNPGSFADFLRSQRLKPGRPPIRLYNGKVASYQKGHIAVLDIDVGNKDLQQCADAYVRMWSEYLWQQGRYNEIRFRFTSGDWASYAQWREGFRPQARLRGVKTVSAQRAGRHGRTVRVVRTRWVENGIGWARAAAPDTSYQGFREFLNVVFNYVGTSSLSRDMAAVANPHDLQIGDAFVRGGFPGHLVFVVDMAENPTTGEKVFLLAQSSTPAKDIHVLRNLEHPEYGAWFPVDFGKRLSMPFWTFLPNQLRRMEGSVLASGSR